MPVIVPAAANYQSPFIAFPAKWSNDPPEGSRFIPLEINWGSMGGPNNSIAVNLQNNATLNFSQISALKYDNSLCGSDVQIVFPDTGDTILAPAYAQAITPVFTNSREFYVIGLEAEPEDVTRLQIFNVVPPPVDLSRSTAVESAGISSIAIVAGTTQVVPNTVNGTMEQLQVGGSIEFSTSLTVVTVVVEDGTGVQLATFSLQGSSAVGSFQSGIFFTSPPIALRFNQGIKLVITETGGGTVTGNIYVNAYYRTP